MVSYRLGTVNDFHLGFKPVLGYSKPHTFTTLVHNGVTFYISIVSLFICSQSTSMPINDTLRRTISQLDVKTNVANDLTISAQLSTTRDARI